MIFVLSWFDWRLVTELSRKSVAQIAMVDFLYYLVSNIVLKNNKKIEFKFLKYFFFYKKAFG